METSDIVARYSNMPGGIIEAFHEIVDRHGFLSQEAIIEAARGFGISVAEAYGVATFYSMFSVKPKGKHVVRVCRSAPCHTVGSAAMVDALQEHLGIKIGETTPDQRFTLELTECVGQCQATPVFTIDGEPYPGLTPSAIGPVLESYLRDGNRKDGR